jgi:hypothetical protein
VIRDSRRLLQLEAEALARIGSRRDPLLFHAARTAVHDRRTMNRSIILNFPRADGSHGCRFSCDFCSWKDTKEVMGDLTPTPGAVAEFLADYQGYKVTLSGGGDPLFDYERNGPRLRALAEQLHGLGLLVEVVTKEIALVDRRLEELSEFVDAWSFSEEKRTTLLHRLLARTPLARVSKVLGPRDRPGDLMSYADFYAYGGAYQVLLREDYLSPLPAALLAAVAGAEKDHPGVVRYLRESVCADNLFLVGREERHGPQPLRTLAA